MWKNKLMQNDIIYFFSCLGFLQFTLWIMQIISFFSKQFYSWLIKQPKYRESFLGQLIAYIKLQFKIHRTGFLLSETASLSTYIYFIEDAEKSKGSGIIKKLYLKQLKKELLKQYPDYIFKK